MLSKNVSPEGKIAANATVKYCPRHSTIAISLICTTCESLHCELCRPQHTGHNLQPINNNGKLVQTVCRSQTQEFYSVLGVLEKEKDDLADLAAFYVEAKTNIQDKIKHLIAKAMEIQSQIETKLDDAHTYAHQSEIKVENDIRLVDDCISQLHGVRNTRDIDVLVPKAVDNAVILAEFQHSKGETDDASLVCPNMGTVFPNMDKLDGSIKELGHVFHMVVEGDDCTLKEVMYYDYSNIKEIDTIPVPNATTDNYQICDADRNNTEEVVLHAHDEKNIVRYNVKTKQYTSRMNDFDIWSGVRVSQSSYVVLDVCNAVHLIDPSGNVLDKLETNDGYDYALCYHSPHKFVKLNRDDDNPCQVILSVINVSSGKFIIDQEIKVTTEDEPDFMCIHRDKDLVSLVSNKSLYTVNFVTSAVDATTIANVIDYRTVFSFHVDSNYNKLVGVSGGNIHVFDSKMNHTILTVVEDTPWGITVRGRKMFVAVNGKIHIFDFDRE